MASNHTRAEKLSLVAAIQQRIDSGHTVSQAIRGLGISRATANRWIAAYKSGGEAALEDKKPTGRPPKLSLNRDEVHAVKFHRLRKESIDLALDEALRKGELRQSTADAILEIRDRFAAARRPVKWPSSLERALFLSPEDYTQFRGPKATGNVLPVGHRNMTWIDEDGTERPLLPGQLWESDDMSTNQPFRYTCPDTGEETAGRQGLYTLDVFSLKWLSASLCGRPRDAYRVEDIADHMLDTVAAYGLPLHWRLERGPWENIMIDGLALDSKRAQKQYGLDRDRFAGKRFGALSEIITIIRAKDSRGKGSVEGSFNHLQSLLAHESTDIGRKRGEFEAAMKHYLRAQRGDARSLNKFWTIDECADATRTAMEKFSAKGKQRDAFGKDLVVPDELWEERPSPRELDPADAWRFFPVKDFATVRHSQITKTVKHWPRPFVFTVNGIDPGILLGTGHRVIAAFHPGRPELGCYLFNCDTRRPIRGGDGFSFGQFLLVAPHFEGVPQIDLRENREPNKDRKRATAAVRSNFAAIKSSLAAKGSPQIKTSTARDGHGLSVAIQSGAAPLEPEAPDGSATLPTSGTTAARRTTKPDAGGGRRTNRPTVDSEELARREAELEDELADL